MAQDDKARAKVILDKHKGYLYGLNVDKLCDELSKIVMQWTYTVFEVFNLLSEQRYTQTELEQVAVNLIDRINPTNLIELAKSVHGSILLARIQYLMNCENNPNQQVCLHISSAYARTHGSTETKIVHESNQTAEPQKLLQAEIDLYKRKVKKGGKFNEDIIWELPESSIGFVVYNRDDIAVDGLDQIGTKETIELIIRLAREWNSHPSNVNKRLLQIGDLSRPGGLDTSQHKGHENGRIVDIRPLRKDSATGKGANLNYRSPSYDQNLTKGFFRFVKSFYPNIHIRFNDGDIAGRGEFTYVQKDTAGKVHDDHYHLEFQ
jgi:hypothetical protein